MLNFFFGFRGRVRRTHYFLGALAAFVVSGMFSAPWLFGPHVHVWRHGWEFGDYGWTFIPLPWAPAFWLIAAVAGVAGFWAQLALAAKRWHDAGTSGWLALLSLIPGVHVIVFLILCLIPPTHGPNQYGPDPRSKPVAA